MSYEIFLRGIRDKNTQLELSLIEHEAVILALTDLLREMRVTLLRSGLRESQDDYAHFEHLLKQANDIVEMHHAKLEGVH